MLMEFSDIQKYLKECKYEVNILKKIQDDYHALTNEN